ncbi:MAG: fibronectin type III domain-containing protein, partial [Chloroflexi bacterium]|nr:fibronectin type III domain-containing protein [Chloroflexota bacterium]
MTKRTGLCGRMRSAGLLLAAALLALVVSGTWTQPRVAEAQSAGIVEVPADWALIPAGLGAGDEFRLLFRSSTQVDATSGFISTWNSRAAARAAAGHEAIREHSSLFKVVGSTGSVDARDNIGMNPNNSAHLDVPVYWLNGPRVAANTAGFWSQSWEHWSDADCRMEDGAVCASPGSWPWTGTNADGTKATQHLGHTPNVRHGSLAMDANTAGPISKNQVVRSQSRPFYVISPVFQVALPPPELSASYTQVYEGERKVIVFETSALSVGFTVSALGGLTTNDYRIYSPPDAAVPLLSTSWTATASNGLVKFALEGVADSEADPGEALRVTLSSSGKAVGRADIKVRDGERPLSLLFRVRRGSPTEEWVETDRPALTLHEGGADVSYQIRVSRDAPGYTTANMHISPNPNELYRIDAIRPGPWDDDRFIYRDPGPHRHGGSTSLIIGTGGWSTVTFGAGQDEDAHNHAITLYHRVSPRAMGWSGLWPVLAGPDSRQYSAPQAGLTGARRFERVSPCFRPGVTSCWTWPLPVQIVDDDKWEQELVYARHDPGANDGNGGPDGNWVLASDGGLRKALPAALAPGSEYTFYIRLAVDPATLPKDGTVSRDQPQSYYQNGQLRTRRVDVYPPTFLPARIPVWVTVKGASNDRHGVPDMRLLITPHSRAAVQPNTGTYFITDTSGTRNHPSVEADYNYRDNTLPGEKGDLLFWDEPMAVTIVVREDAPLGVSRGLSVRSDSGMLTRPGCGRGWSKYNCTGDYSGYYFWDGLDIAIGLVEDLKPRGQFSARDFAPRTPEEVFEFVKLANFGNEEAPFVPFADVTEERGGIGDGARASITEGETARFTVTLTPAPSEPRAVTVNVLRREGSTELGVAGRLGVRTVMVGPSGSARLEIPTADNDEVGDNGYLQVAVVSSPTYRVSAFGGVAELDVLSDDAELVSDAVRVQRVTDSAATIVWDPQPGAASYEVVWLEGTGTATRTAFTSGTSIELTGLEPGRSYDVAVLDDLWNRVGSVEFLTLEPGGGERFYPVLSVTAGAGVTEGGTASFTVTASPAPGAPLTVPLWVSQRGAYAAAGERGVRRVTIPASGSVSFEVATVDDASDEPDGAIVATLERAKLGYHLGASARAEVGVADNDDGSASPE